MQIGDTFCEGLLKYSVVNATEVAVKGFADDFNHRNAKTLLIPVRVRGMSVVTITKEAFAQSRLEEVDIPETITVIGTEAFASCRWLRHVRFGKRDAKKTILIDERAFIACPYLVKVLSEDKSAVVQLSIHAFHAVYAVIAAALFLTDYAGVFLGFVMCDLVHTIGRSMN